MQNTKILKYNIDIQNATKTRIHINTSIRDNTNIQNTNLNTKIQKREIQK